MNKDNKLSRLQEMFRGKIEPAVVELVLTECQQNVDDAVVQLITLTEEPSNTTSNKDVGLTSLSKTNTFNDQLGNITPNKEQRLTPTSLMIGTQSGAIESSKQLNSTDVSSNACKSPPQVQNTSKLHSTQKSSDVSIPANITNSKPAQDTKATEIDAEIERLSKCIAYNKTQLNNFSTKPSIQNLGKLDIVSSNPRAVYPIVNPYLRYPFGPRSPQNVFIRQPQRVRQGFPAGFPPAVFPPGFIRPAGRPLRMTHPVCHGTIQHRPHFVAQHRQCSPEKNQYSDKRALPKNSSNGHPHTMKQETISPPSRKLTILRGLPGSGKSTLARMLATKGGVIISTDDYFLQCKGYCFNPIDLAKAHEWNQHRAKQFMESGFTPVIVDNTNTQVWEMRPYVLTGLRCGYKIDIREPETWWKWNIKELARRNKHEVPLQTLCKMIERYEKNVTVESIVKTVRPTMSNKGNKITAEQSPTINEKDKKISSQSNSVQGIGSEIKNPVSFEKSSAVDFDKIVGFSNVSDVPHKQQLGTSETSEVKRGLVHVSELEQEYEGMRDDEHTMTTKDELVMHHDGLSDEKSSKVQPELDRDATCNSDGQAEDATRESGMECCLTHSNDGTKTKELSNLSLSSAFTDICSQEKTTENIRSLSSQCSANVDKCCLPDCHCLRDTTETEQLLGTSTARTDQGNCSEELYTDNFDDISDNNKTIENCTGGSQLALIDKTDNPTIEQVPVSQDDCSEEIYVDNFEDMVDEETLKDRTVSNVKPVTNDLLLSDKAKNILTTEQACVGQENYGEELYVDDFEEMADEERIKNYAEENRVVSHVTTNLFLSDKTENANPAKDVVPMEISPNNGTTLTIGIDDQGQLLDKPENKQTGNILGTPVANKENYAQSNNDTSESPNPMKFLMDCFSHISVETLQMRLNRCEGDLMRTVNSLIEYSEDEELDDTTKYVGKFDQKHSSPEALEKASQYPSHTSNSSIRLAANFGEMKEIYGGDSKKDLRNTPVKSNSNDSQDISNSSLRLTLDPALALQLLEIFGSFSGISAKDTLSEDELAVEIDQEFSKILYTKWRKTVQKRRKISEVARIKKVSSSPAMCGGHPKRKFVTPPREFYLPGDFQSPPTKHPPLTEPVSLKEIMDEQLAIHVRNSEEAIENNWKEENLDLSTKLKRSRLHGLFPGIDATFLSEIFEANNYNLDQTIQLVQSSIGGDPRAFHQQLCGEQKVVSLTDGVHTGSPTTEDTCRTGSNYQSFSDPTYKDFRAEAETHYKLRDECIKKAALAYSKKQGQLANVYAGQARAHGDRLKEANRRAAMKILKIRNNDLQSSNELDLHELHVSEAIEVLETVLEERKKELRGPNRRSPSFIQVITGRGNRSREGKARIKPAVVDYLKRNGYRKEDHQSVYVLVLLI